MRATKRGAFLIEVTIYSSSYVLSVSRIIIIIHVHNHTSHVYRCLLRVGVASVCSEEALLCTNTLSLDLEEVFADVPRPEVQFIQLIATGHF